MKLNELIAAVKGASNRMIDVEDLSEEDLHDLQGRFQRLARASAVGEAARRRAMSVEEVEAIIEHHAATKGRGDK